MIDNVSKGDRSNTWKWKGERCKVDNQFAITEMILVCLHGQACSRLSR